MLTIPPARPLVERSTKVSPSLPRRLASALGPALAPLLALSACGDFHEGLDGTWTETAPLHTPRLRQHTATLLRDGRVLVTGGVKDWYKLDVALTETAEIYDPATNAWTETAAMPGGPRAGHSAVLLGDGSVLTMGAGPDARYVPATAEWTLVGGRVGQSSGDAVVLDDGKVLSVSLYGGTPIAQLFDPGPSLWSEVSPMLAVRDGCRLLLLPSGEVMALGGQEPADSQDMPWVPSLRAEIFSPAGRAWREAAPLDHEVGDAVALPSGDVLAVGLTAQGPRASRWSPSTGRWQTAPAPLVGGFEAQPPVLRFDLVVRGDDVLALFHAWHQAPPMQRLASGAGAWVYLQQPPVEFGTATLLADGRVLATGHGYPSSQGFGVPSENGLRAAVLTP